MAIPKILKLTVHNWFSLYAIFTIELMEGFINGIERQASVLIDKYELEKETHVLLDAPEDNFTWEVVTHQGLDDQTFDLQSIFSEYFPSLQRRSALLTIYAIFENELDTLCKLYESEQSYKIPYSEVRGKGIDHSTNYLKKVVGINTHRDSPEWDEIQNIRKIRNLIAHQDGKLPCEKSKKQTDRASVVRHINKIESLGFDEYDEDEFVLKNGYLSYVVNIFKKYLEMINQSIGPRIT